MDLSLSCGCGMELRADDITPATAELLVENWNVQHPHDEERARMSLASYPLVDETEEQQ